jgi:hypothetical protein
MTDTGLPYLPGVATVSEILAALEAEYTELKFLPTQAAGGANYLKSIRFTDLIGTLLPDRRNLHHRRRPVSGPAERRFASISPGTRVFVAGGRRVAGRLPDPALVERRRDTQGGVSCSRWRRGAQLRRAPAAHFVRGSERVSAGVTTAVPARYRGGPGR